MRSQKQPVVSKIEKQRRLRFLITAGGTREYIDPVRFISNAGSGKMGYELARVAAARGHGVTLITAPTGLQAAERVGVFEVESAGEMFEAVKSRFSGCDCLIMAAAVADFTPLRPSRTKIKKCSGVITLKLKPTPDILNWAGSHKRRGQVVVGFALEDRELRASSEKKLREKNLDMVVANKPTAIGADKTSVWIKTSRRCPARVSSGCGWLAVRNRNKSAIAGQIIRLVERLARFQNRYRGG
jgi:phosphopantothenoylcysteine decarboxylase/phosphopantothenate--cysteine ligase